MSIDVTVGNRDVLFFGTILVPESESASLSFPDRDGDNVLLRLTFEESESENEQEEKNTRKDKKRARDRDKKPKIRVREEDGVGVICFIDWTKAFGSSTAVPIVFGEGESGAKISFLANIAKLGGVYKVEFQVMTEGPS